MNKFSSETKEQIQRIICWYTQCSICKQCGLPRSHVCSCDEAMKILDDKGYAKYIKNILATMGENLPHIMNMFNERLSERRIKTLVEEIDKVGSEVG